VKSCVYVRSGITEAWIDPLRCVVEVCREEDVSAYPEDGRAESRVIDGFAIDAIDVKALFAV